jgi:hypothetical protein
MRGQENSPEKPAPVRVWAVGGPSVDRKIVRRQSGPSEGTGRRGTEHKSLLYVKRRLGTALRLPFLTSGRKLLLLIDDRSVWSQHWWEVTVGARETIVAMFASVCAELHSWLWWWRQWAPLKRRSVGHLPYYTAIYPTSQPLSYLLYFHTPCFDFPWRDRVVSIHILYVCGPGFESRSLS